MARGIVATSSGATTISSSSSGAAGGDYESEAELMLDGDPGLAIDFTDGSSGSAFVRSE